MNSTKAQLTHQRPPIAGGGEGERDRGASRLLRLLRLLLWMPLGIGACLVFTSRGATGLLAAQRSH